jgi:hypothetical protein
MSSKTIQEALNSAKITVIKKPGSNKEYFLKNQSNDDYEIIEKALEVRSIPQYGKIEEVLI